jgi:hypothetical protein
VITALDEEMAAAVGKLALLDILDPGPKDAQWHLVLGFTGNRAGMAPDARALIDEKAIIHRMDAPAWGESTATGAGAAASRR